MSGPSLSAFSELFRKQLSWKAPLPTSDFTGQTVIVTGGNAGLGREAVKHLARLNAGRVILACRTVSKGEEAQKAILEETKSSTQIEVWALDLCSFDSVKAFASRAEGLDRLDAVIQNAGTWPTKFELAEGNEVTITVNVISTALLTYLLLPKLRETGKKYNTIPRVSIVSSILHKMASLKARKSDKIFEGLRKETADFSVDDRYNDSKLLEVIFVRKLAAEVAKSEGSRGAVYLNSMSPGYCLSGLKPPTDFGTRMAERMLARTTDEGGRCLVDAVAPETAKERHGKYLSEMAVTRASSWLETKDGKQTEDRVWSELNEIVEGISPGCTHVA